METQYTHRRVDRVAESTHPGGRYVEMRKTKSERKKRREKKEEREIESMSGMGEKTCRAAPIFSPLSIRSPPSLLLFPVQPPHPPPEDKVEKEEARDKKGNSIKCLWGK